MIAITYDRLTGQVISQITCEASDIGRYETEDVAAAEILSPLSWNADICYVDLSVIETYVSVIAVSNPKKDLYSWDWSSHSYVPDIPLAAAAARRRVKAGQMEMKYGNFVWSGYVFQGDESSQGQISSKALEALLAQTTSTPFSKEFVLADNSTINLDAAQMLAVFGAMQANIQAAVDQAIALQTDIDAAALLTPALTAVEALDAITWIAP